MSLMSVSQECRKYACEELVSAISVTLASTLVYWAFSFLFYLCVY